MTTADILLSEALDLCIRARSLDEMQRCEAQLAASLDPEGWQAISTRSATMPLWAADQYEQDLADWERRARAYLQEALL